jgi:hypothetical protein
LLKMIVPDEDLGLPENVEDIVTAMIKHNSWIVNFMLEKRVMNNDHI